MIFFFTRQNDSVFFESSCIHGVPWLRFVRVLQRWFENRFRDFAYEKKKGGRPHGLGIIRTASYGVGIVPKGEASFGRRQCNPHKGRISCTGASPCNDPRDETATQRRGTLCMNNGVDSRLHDLFFGGVSWRYHRNTPRPFLDNAR